jgi:hypothetical protein
MTNAPSDADPPCHNMTERECKLVKKIEKTAEMYDQLSMRLSELVCALQNNDQYFMNHMVQIQLEAHDGKTQRESYIETLEHDAMKYSRELHYMENVVRRAMGMIPVREIRFENDEDKSDALTV